MAARGQTGGARRPGRDPGRLPPAHRSAGAGVGRDDEDTPQPAVLPRRRAGRDRGCGTGRRGWQTHHGVAERRTGGSEDHGAVPGAGGQSGGGDDDPHAQRVQRLRHQYGTGTAAAGAGAPGRHAGGELSIPLRVVPAGVHDHGGLPRSGRGLARVAGGRRSVPGNRQPLHGRRGEPSGKGEFRRGGVAGGVFSVAPAVSAAGVFSALLAAPPQDTGGKTAGVTARVPTGSAAGRCC